MRKRRTREDRKRLERFDECSHPVLTKSNKSERKQLWKVPQTEDEGSWTSRELEQEFGRESPKNRTGSLKE